jgi:hypothetical protein
MTDEEIGRNVGRAVGAFVVLSLRVAAVILSVYWLWSEEPLMSMSALALAAFWAWRQDTAEQRDPAVTHGRE